MGWSMQRARAVFLTALFLVMMPGITAQSTPASTLDQNVNAIDLNPDEVNSFQIETAANTSVLLSWACSSCTVSADDGEAHITAIEHSDSMLSIHTEQAGPVGVSVSSTATETMTLMVLTNISADNHLAVRPAPENDVLISQPAVCLQAINCIDPTSGHLSASLDSTDTTTLPFTGDVRVTEDQYMVFNASVGDSLEWQWTASTRAVNLQIYHQTAEEEVLLNGISTAVDGFSHVNQPTPS